MKGIERRLPERVAADSVRDQPDSIHPESLRNEAFEKSGNDVPESDNGCQPANRQQQQR
ncbi:MAG: hypothetical protein AAGB22_02565 [Bacteroidota bacterium]